MNFRDIPLSLTLPQGNKIKHKRTIKVKFFEDCRIPFIVFKELEEILQ